MNSTWKRALRRLCLVGWLCLAQAPAGASGDAPAPYLYQGADRLHKLVEGARREGSVPVTTPLDPQDPGPLVVAAAAFAPHRQYVAHRFNFLTIACNTRLVKRDEVPASSAVGSTPHRFAYPLIDPAIVQGGADRLNRCGRSGLK
jgi:hypothetical protein